MISENKRTDNILKRWYFSIFYFEKSYNNIKYIFTLNKDSARCIV